MRKSAIRIVVLGGPEPRRLGCLRLEKKEIRIGRMSPRDGQAGPDVAFDFDYSVSRHHARLAHIDGKWYLVDLQSKSGTQVNGREISGCGAVELSAGEIVTTGETSWTLVPDDWLYIHDAPIFVTASYAKAVNYSLYHSGVPVVGRITVVNCGRRTSAAFCLKLIIEGFSDWSEIDVPSLLAGRKVDLGVPSIPLRIDMLRRQTEPVQTRLRMEVVEQPHTADARDICVLGFWDWPYEQAARKTLAAFVSPRNPVVEHLILEAQAQFKERTGFDSFRSLLRSNRRDAEYLILERLYNHLRENTDIRFENPKVIGSFENSMTYQTVKPPHHVFSRHVSSILGKAKCLDLAVLFAGCLENVGLLPTIVLMGEEDMAPRHALAGCWTTPTPYGTPLISQDKIVCEMRAGNLLLTECLGIVAEATPQRAKLTFRQAVDTAVRILRGAKWAQGIDIASLRPPYGAVLPMENPLEPEVEGAFEKARLFAESRKLPTVETTHLFYGLIAANSSLLRWLLGKAGLRSEVICRQLDELFQVGRASRPPAVTDNFLQCKRRAEEYAAQAGSPSIQQHHLLWALLEGGSSHGSFYGNCRKLGIDMERLRKLLSEQYPPPRGHGFGSVPVDQP